MMHTTRYKVAAGSKILALCALLVALMTASLVPAAKSAHASTTFTVNSTADHADANLALGACDTGYTVTGAEPAPECTLRAAMEQANYTPGADAVNFAIPGSGVRTITPDSELPRIAGPLTINGYSQPGAKPDTAAAGNGAILRMELSGAGAPGADGIRIGAANTTVKGLVINRWDQGVRIDGPNATGIEVEGNFIGTDASGKQDLGNTTGVRVYHGSNNTIGGTMAAERNVISGNSIGVSLGDGIVVKGNEVLGNYIGTDATGTKDLGNSYDGIVIEDTADNTTDTVVGGTTAGARNVISGNDSDGVGIVGDANKVVGNFIGTDVTGTKDLGNSSDGVFIHEASSNVIGGAAAGARNVISGNSRDGVVIEGAGATGNKIMGNFIGTDKSGTAPLGNSSVGVFVFYAPNNTVGGTQAGAGNVISAHNPYEGVSIYGDSAAGNRVLSNSIFANGGLGIDLGADGPTANDPKDADSGPNNLQNKPALTSATSSKRGTTIRGTLNSTPNGTFTVQFFSNPGGTDEGKKFLGQRTVSAAGSGSTTFAFSTTNAVKAGQNATATATNNVTGDTSEFSAPRNVVAR